MTKLIKMNEFSFKSNRSDRTVDVWREYMIMIAFMCEGEFEPKIATNSIQISLEISRFFF